MAILKSPRLNLLSLTLIALCAAPNFYTMAQSKEAKIEQITPYETAVPGQMLSLIVTGLEMESLLTEIPLSDFTIDIIQNGATVKAPIRAASQISRWEAKSAELKAGVQILFTVPQVPQAGEASLALFYRGVRNGSTKLTIATRPLAPRITPRIIAIGAPGATPPRLAKAPNAPVYTFERGREELIDVHPLFDPQEKEGVILFKFRQGSDIHQATALIKYLPASEPRGRTFALRPSQQYESYVKIPAGLAPGEATMEVQSQIRGQISDPTSVSVLITDINKTEDNPRASAPRILSLSKTRVGIGQTFDVFVERRSQLEPSPSQAMVILEQAGDRYQLKPEFNSVNFNSYAAPNRMTSEPVVLRVRTRADIIGPVKVRVLNPYLGEDMGLSEGISLEIINRVLQPENVVIRESTDNDLELLRRMREASMKAGRQWLRRFG